ncbi:SCP-like protein [Necator americanus]|uniref:SCP-like protein n=1 Tax=Necator americanus TaxID=51031 RepID=W2TTI0_NECAM|nr:SCP-like protein [Necator americanus]ETN84357.1 SCP-like protein [Necator americanus]
MDESQEIKKYDCAAERDALHVAKKCMNIRTPCKWLHGYGENIARVMAVTKWWEEFTRHGNHRDNVYTTELHENGSLEHYAQIAWSRTTHIGCAVQDCSSSSMVVCRYKPTGKRLNDVIYEVGDTCSACPRGTICEQQTGLCV